MLLPELRRSIWPVAPPLLTRAFNIGASQTSVDSANSAWLIARIWLTTRWSISLTLPKNYKNLIWYSLSFPPPPFLFFPFLLPSFSELVFVSNFLSLWHCHSPSVVLSLIRPPKFWPSNAPNWLTWTWPFAALLYLTPPCGALACISIYWRNCLSEAVSEWPELASKLLLKAVIIFLFSMSVNAKTSPRGLRRVAMTNTGPSTFKLLLVSVASSSKMSYHLIAFCIRRGLISHSLHRPFFFPFSVSYK